MPQVVAAPEPSRAYDVLVVGGGPGGSTAALQAARNGLDVLLLEEGRHPRFHIGESFLPPTLDVIRDLGLEEGARRLPQVRKLGASFVLGHEKTPQDFHFEDGLLEANPETFNIARAPFDAFLLDAARAAGVTVVENAPARKIVRLDDEMATLEAREPSGSASSYSGRFLLDASGLRTLVGQHLGTRRRMADHKKAAYYGHFSGVRRREGRLAGYPIVVFCREGWFWIIPLDETMTSIGLVMDAGVAKGIDVAPDQMLAWGIARCPFVWKATEGARFPDTTMVVADFSYSCQPYAGPGYFMVGDSATFIDPIFSTGVCLAMKSGVKAADTIAEILAGSVDRLPARREYCRYVAESSGALFRLVKMSYEHACRELLLSGSGPMKLHRAVISLLTGHVFPRPEFTVRWRIHLLAFFVKMQKLLPLSPRRNVFSLLEGEIGGRFRLGPAPQSGPDGLA